MDFLNCMLVYIFKATNEILSLVGEAYHSKK